MQALVLGNEWAREEFRAFGLWLLAEKPDHRALTKLVAKHFPLFERLDAHLDRIDGLDANYLLDLFGVSGPRSHVLPMRFLALRHGIRLNEAAKIEHVERQRIAAIVSQNQDETWGKLLEQYRQWLANNGMQTRTARLYISAAARFCRDHSLGREGRFTAEDLTRFLRRAPGLRANLFRWLAFCREDLGINVAMPPPKRRRRLPSHVRELAALLREIEQVGAENAPRKLLARALAKAFGFRVNQFTDRSWKLRLDGTAIASSDGDEVLQVPHRLQSLAEAFVSTQES